MISLEKEINRQTDLKAKFIETINQDNQRWTCHKNSHQQKEWQCQSQGQSHPRPCSDQHQ